MAQDFSHLGLPEALSNQAVSLDALNVAEVAWPRAAALSLLDFLDAASVPVAGGDVLRLEKEGPTYTYDNWYSERKPGESTSAYGERSRAETRKYLESYAEHNGTFLYVLVIPDRAIE